MKQRENVNCLIFPRIKRKSRNMRLFMPLFKVVGSATCTAASTEMACLDQVTLAEHIPLQIGFLLFSSAQAFCHLKTVKLVLLFNLNLGE